MADNGNGGRGHVQTLTTTAAAIFNLGAILLLTVVLIPMTMNLSTKMDHLHKSIDNFDKTAKRLNDAMDANEARIKAAKK